MLIYKYKGGPLYVFTKGAITCHRITRTFGLGLALLPGDLN